MKILAQKSFMQGLRSAILAILQKVQPSKSNRGNWKILFVLGSYEYLERLKGKIKEGILK